MRQVGGRRVPGFARDHSDHAQAMITTSASLQQVKEARLTADFDDRNGATSGPWTTEMFVEAVYTSLKKGVKK